MYIMFISMYKYCQKVRNKTSITAVSICNAAHLVAYVVAYVTLPYICCFYAVFQCRSFLFSLTANVASRLTNTMHLHHLQKAKLLLESIICNGTHLMNTVMLQKVGKKVQERSNLLPRGVEKLLTKMAKMSGGI